MTKNQLVESKIKQKVNAMQDDARFIEIQLSKRNFSWIYSYSCKFSNLGHLRYNLVYFQTLQEFFHSRPFHQIYFP